MDTRPPFFEPYFHALGRAWLHPTGEYDALVQHHVDTVVDSLRSRMTWYMDISCKPGDFHSVPNMDLDMTDKLVVMASAVPRAREFAERTQEHDRYVSTLNYTTLRSEPPAAATKDQALASFIQRCNATEKLDIVTLQDLVNVAFRIRIEMQGIQEALRCLYEPDSNPDMSRLHKVYAQFFTQEQQSYILGLGLSLPTMQKLPPS